MTPSRQEGQQDVPRTARFDCGECGMNVAAREFHPYWYCVLFKNGVDPRTIEAEAAAGQREVSEQGSDSSNEPDGFMQAALDVEAISYAAESHHGLFWSANQQDGHAAKNWTDCDQWPCAYLARLATPPNVRSNPDGFDQPAGAD